MDRAATRHLTAWVLVAIGLLDIGVAIDAIVTRHRPLELLVIPTCLLLLGISYFVRERWRPLSWVLIGISLVGSLSYLVVLIQRRH